MKNHLLWIIMLLCGIIIFALTGPLTAHLTQQASQNVMQLKNSKAEKKARIRQWEKDVMEAEALSNSIAANEIQQFLAPGNRAAMAEQLELLASAAQLHSFSFTLSPATPWQGNKEFPNFKDVDQSRFTFSTKAPYEAALYRFFDSLNGMAGRAEIQNVTITRLANSKLSNQNLLIKAELIWIMNGANVGGDK